MSDNEDIDDGGVTTQFFVEVPGRLDKVLTDMVGDLSRSRLKNLILEHQVLLNGKMCNDPSLKVAKDDEIILTVPDAIEAEPIAEDIPLDIIYEDADLLVINKPVGMVVHPGAGNHSGTLVNALLHHCGSELSGIGGVKRPGIVHRLDKDTSGLMMVAKTDRAHKGLSEQLQDRSLSRIYQAFVWKEITPIKGTIDVPIGRHQTNRLKMSVRSHKMGREAITHYLRQETFNKVISLVSCQLETGRTHQIRVHMQHAGHPLIGDPQYGLVQQEQRSLMNRGGYDEESRDAVLAFPRQALHAGQIMFIHPVTGEEMEFSSDWPEDLENLFSIINQ
jgi:23S rRNA pseudouridine1911/1915/1917 synthase